MQPYFNPTRRNMEDDPNILENGRQPQFLLKEDNLNFFENRRRPPQKIMQQKQLNVKTKLFLKMEDDLIFF
jgi:hypothetical protein